MASEDHIARLKALEKHIDQVLSKKIRVVAENPQGRFSSTWMFWGNKSDFYFGAKNLTGSFKVSLHENGRGYVAYDKKYFQKKIAAGIAIPGKTAFEWELPKPRNTGAVHAASLLLPANYCFGDALSEKARRKTLVFGVEADCAAEIGVFLSHEGQETLAPKFVNLGKPIVMTTLDNQLKVSLVARSQPFDPSILPKSEILAKSKNLLLQSEPVVEQKNLNALLFTAPKDGEALQVLDVGGVALRRVPLSNRGDV